MQCSVTLLVSFVNKRCFSFLRKIKIQLKPLPRVHAGILPFTFPDILDKLIYCEVHEMKCWKEDQGKTLNGLYKLIA